MTESAIKCWSCGQVIASGEIVCQNCHALIYKQQLELLADQATRLEPTQPRQAATLWLQALPLLPRGSKQFETVQHRAEELWRHAENMSPSATFTPPAPPPLVQTYRPKEAQNDSWPTILLKTGGSALLTAWFLQTLGGWWFAGGFVLLILIHELGHSLANLYYGLRASPPIFLGPLGAIILLRDPPPNAKVESVIGIAGPVFGTVAALGMFAYWKYSGNEMAQELSYFGFWLNLFNLIPLPPLDGGRAVAAVSPRIWPVGIAGLIGLAIYRYTHGQMRGESVSLFIFIYILMQAWPRVAMTMKYLPQMKAYFDVPTAFRIAMALLHGGLAVGLYLLMEYSAPTWAR